MGILWRKLARDLWRSKTRTALVVLSTAVGLLALGLSLGLAEIMTARMTASHRASHPPHLMFWAQGKGFDASICQAIERLPDVRTCQTSGEFTIRWKRPGDPYWRNGSLQTIRDVHRQQVHIMTLLEGTWPEGRAIALERQTARYLHLKPGATLLVEVNGRPRPVPVTGIVRDPLVFPPQFGGDPTFVTTPRVATWLTGAQKDNVLNVQLTEFEKARAREVGKTIRHRLRRSGIQVAGPWLLDPNRHFIQDQVDTLMRILLGLSGLALGLSVFLIVNTMNAIIVQQVWQIGVLKVLGARRRHILVHYLSMAVAYGVLATLVAVPLAAVAAHFLATYLLDFINITPGPFVVRPHVVLAQALTGIVVPILAALLPVLGGLRVTAQESLRTRGIGAHFGRGWVDRVLVHVRFLSRPILLSLRNTFRRKVRITLTLLALMFAGVLFIMVMSVGRSLNQTLEDVLHEYGGDVWVVVASPQRVERLESLARQDPAVEHVEVWRRVAATLRMPNGGKKQIGLRGLPVPSRVFGARVVEGRTLLPGEGRAILLNEKTAREEDIHVGDEVTVIVGKKEIRWRVVGLVYSVTNNHTESFVPLDALGRSLGSVGRGERVYISLKDEARADADTVARRLRQRFEDAGIRVVRAGTAEDARRAGRNQFNILVYTLLVMSVLAAIVGSVGLMGALSISVVERQREIGVLRAIGAHDRVLMSIFVVEGLVVGLSSWFMAVPVSIPLSWGFAQAVGSMMSLPLQFHYSAIGVLLWLVIVILTSALASLVPAWQAARIPVRESLAYE